MVARPTSLVDIVEGHDVPGAQGIPQGIRIHSRRFQDPANAHMTRDDGIGDAGELPVKQVDVGAANLAGHCLQEDGSRLENRVVQLPHLNWSMGSHHDCCSYAHEGKVGRDLGTGHHPRDRKGGASETEAGFGRAMKAHSAGSCELLVWRGRSARSPECSSRRDPVENPWDRAPPQTRNGAQPNQRPQSRPLLEKAPEPFRKD